MDFADLFLEDVDEQEPPEPPVEHRRPEWLAPPEGELGVPVPLAVVLARTERGVVAVSHAVAYSAGVSLELVAHVGGLKMGQTNSLFHEQHAGRMGSEDLPDGFLRFGVELAGEQRVSNLGRQRRLLEPGRSPTGPVLFQHGGGGGQSSGTSITWSLAFWLWPLPPTGTLRLFCEWPVAQIELSSVELDPSPILEAAARTTELWSDEDRARGGAWTSASTGQHVMSFAAVADSEQGPGDAEAEATVAVPAGELRELESALASAQGVLRRILRRAR